MKEFLQKLWDKQLLCKNVKSDVSGKCVMLQTESLLSEALQGESVNRAGNVNIL
jgi:hypothetical protein